MNFKSLIFTILLVSAPLSAMKLEPGTVIKDLNRTGQFTVSIAEGVSSFQSGLPTVVSQVSKASSDIFKNKGIPVIISTAAGMVPWWALTTGTGYLIICQCGISDPALLSSIASGASYAAGEQSNSAFKKYINNPYAQSFARVALCASCLGLSYFSANPLISDAFYATGNAIGLQTVLETCTGFLNQAKTNTPSNQSEAWYSLSPAMKANLFEATVNTVGAFIPSLCTTNICDPNAMLRILLYEQAYRLAHCGCIAAQHFINK